MLGRFLEISLESGAVADSLLFYEQLGLRSLETGDTWNHPYAVLSDGSVALALHQYEFASPSLTFVHPGVADELTELIARGVELEFAKTDNDEFNEIGFLAPGKHMVTILEARTFSPPPFADTDVSLLGSFEHIALPVWDLEAAVAFWERLDFFVSRGGDQPFAWTELEVPSIRIALYENRRMRQPAVVFAGADFDAVTDRVAPLGHEFTAPRLWAQSDPDLHGVLQTPEGLALAWRDI